MAAAGSTFSAARIASVLASAQITITATRPRTASPGFQQHVLREDRRPEGGGHLADDEADQPQPSACCRIMPAMVRLRVPMSLSTAISRILPSVIV
jgi:hypothetical protein